MKKMLFYIGALLWAFTSCSSPPTENVVIVQPAPKTNLLRLPEKVKKYTSGKYADRSDQLHEAHPVHRIVQSPRWNLSYTPRNAVSVSPGAIRIAAPVSPNLQSYRSRLAQVEQENKKQADHIAQLAAQEGKQKEKEIADLRTELQGLRKEVASLNKVDPMVEELKNKVASLEKKLSERSTVTGNVWIPIKESSK